MLSSFRFNRVQIAFRQLILRAGYSTAARPTAQRAVQLQALRDVSLNVTPDALLLAVSDASAAGPTLSRDTFQKVVSALGVKSPAQANAFFNAFDTDNSGCVSMEELTTGLSLLMNAAPKERRNIIFRAWDSDKNGTIDKAEFVAVGLEGTRRDEWMLSHAMADMHLIEDPKGRAGSAEDARKTAESLFSELDSNKDGQLSFEEFEKGCERAGRA